MYFLIRRRSVASLTSIRLISYQLPVVKINRKYVKNYLYSIHIRSFSFENLPNGFLDHYSITIVFIDFQKGLNVSMTHQWWRHYSWRNNWWRCSNGTRHISYNCTPMIFQFKQFWNLFLRSIVKIILWWYPLKDHKL